MLIWAEAMVWNQEIWTGTAEGRFIFDNQRDLRVETEDATFDLASRRLVAPNRVTLIHYKPDGTTRSDSGQSATITLSDDGSVRRLELIPFPR